METFGSLDFIVNHPMNYPAHDPKRALIFVQGEAGFLPWIVGRGVIGKRKPDYEILSRYMDVEALNMIPNPVAPGWLVTQVSEDTLVVNITNWFPVSPLPDSNHGMWFRTYPMMRDLVLWLREMGVEELFFLAAMNSQNVVKEDEGVEIYSIDGEEDPIPLLMPAWFIPYFFKKNGGESHIVAVEQDEGLFIDDEALARIGAAVAWLGFSMDTKSMQEAIEHIFAHKEEIEGIEGLFNGVHNGEDEGEDWS